MLSQQENAWEVYAALFLFFTLFLLLRCRKNLLLIPFVVFGMLITIGTIILLAAHFSDYGTDNDALYWESKSLVLSLLPAASVLVLFGIMEAQLIFIQHLAVALSNRDHWKSIYLRDNAEKLQAFQSSTKKKASLRPWTYWTSLVIVGIYFIVAIGCVIIQTTSDSFLGVAICVTLLSILACFNVGVVFYSCNGSHHVNTIRQNRDDLLFLRFTPILFAIFMLGMMMLYWIYYTVEEIPISVWIVLESFTVYLPLILILIMCIYTGKIQTMGRQYPIEAAQQRQYSYSTVVNVESVTNKKQEEVKKKIPSAPPATYYPY